MAERGIRWNPSQPERRLFRTGVVPASGYNVVVSKGRLRAQHVSGRSAVGEELSFLYPDDCPGKKPAFVGVGRRWWTYQDRRFKVIEARRFQLRHGAASIPRSLLQPGVSQGTPGGGVGVSPPQRVLHRMATIRQTSYSMRNGRDAHPTQILQDSVQEFQVPLEGLSAAYGRAFGRI